MYFDTTDVVLAVTSPTGGFAMPVSGPASAQPGGHWVSAVGRADGLAAQAKFTVRTDWPEFRFDARDQRVNPYENTLTPSTVSGLDEAWQYSHVLDLLLARRGGRRRLLRRCEGRARRRDVYSVNAATGVLKWKFAPAAR